MEQKPSPIAYGIKSGQLFIQFTEDNKSINDHTVDEILLKENDLHSINDYEKNVDNPPPANK